MQMTCTEQQAQQVVEILADENFHRNSYGEHRLKFIESGRDDDNKNRELRENIAKHSEGNAGNVFNTTTINMHVQRQRQNTTITLQTIQMQII